MEIFVLYVIVAVQSVAIALLWKRSRGEDVWQKAQTILNEWKHGKKATWEAEFQGSPVGASKSTRCTIESLTQSNDNAWFDWKCACGNSGRSWKGDYRRDIRRHKNAMKLVSK